MSKVLTHVRVHLLLCCRLGLMAGMMWCVLWQTWGHCQMHDRHHKLQAEQWVCVPVTLWGVGVCGCGRRILGCCAGSKGVCNVTRVYRNWLMCTSMPALSAVARGQTSSI